MRKERFLGGVGVGAALAIALGAVSILLRAGWTGFGQSRSEPEAARLPRATSSQPVILPEDFEQKCRLAGI